MKFALIALRSLRWLGSWLLAFIILFEEWGWEPLQQILARMGRLPGLRWIERRVRTLSPWASVALFALPTAFLLPVKLISLWVIGKGHVVAGMLMIVAAKVAGTAVVARIFTLTQPALMRLPWFAWVYGHWSRIKSAVVQHVRASWLWRLARVLKRRWRIRAASVR